MVVLVVIALVAAGALAGVLATRGAAPTLEQQVRDLTDRLDPDGNLSAEPWGHARFAAALDAEVTACESSDPAAERARRARAYAARRMTLKVHDDGTATLRITGPAATMVGAYQRHDRSARNLRKGGDPRTLDQLRAVRDGLTAQLDALAGSVANAVGEDDSERESMREVMAYEREHRWEPTILCVSSPSWRWYPVSVFSTGYREGLLAVESSRTQS